LNLIFFKKKINDPIFNQSINQLISQNYDKNEGINIFHQKKEKKEKKGINTFNFKINQSRLLDLFE